MPEGFSDSNPERHPIRVIFGDVILGQSFFDGLPAIVVRVYPAGGVEAMAIINEDENRYGLPGGLPPDDIQEVIGHKAFDEVAAAYIPAYTDALGEEPAEADHSAMIRELDEWARQPSAQ